MSWLRKYLNQEGSTFIFVIMMMAVLIILGTALLFASTTNYAMNASYIKGNRSFYGADGWIERVNNLLEEKTILIQEEAKDDAEDMKASIISRYTVTDPETGEVTIDYDNIEKELQIEYRDAFNKYVTGQIDLVDNDTLEEMLESEFAAWVAENSRFSVTYTLSSYPGRNGVDLDNQLASVNTPVTITVLVESNMEGMRKKIVAQFEFLKYSEQVPMKKSLVRRKNPIWMRAITTESSLVSVGGQLIVKGLDNDGNDTVTSVYAYGNLPPDNSSGYQYGGIIAGLEPQIADELEVIGLSNTNGNITINGTAKTRANIHTAYSTDEVPSDIHITGDAYCESVQIENTCENSTIDIDGNVYAYNDLKVNGSNSEIIVNGNYYGFMEGGLGSYQYNKSSAIILNDISSSIEVKGEAYIGGKVYVEYIYVNAEDEYGAPTGIRVPYKTGESVSIGQNYNAYRYMLSSENINDFDPTWIPYKMFWGIGDPAARLVAPNNDNNERMRHFTSGYDTDDIFRTIINRLGVILGTNTEMKVYAPGVVFSDGYILDPSIGKAYDLNGDEVLPESGVLKLSIEGQSDKKAVTFFEKSVFDANRSTWERAFNKATWIQQDKGDTQYKVINDSQNDTEFDELVAESIGTSPFENFSEAGTSNRYYIDTSGSDVHLSGSQINGKEGIIFTTGDLYISAETNIEFTGAIISKGHIVFHGSGEKTIAYNEDAVKNAINNQDILINFFKPGNKIIDLKPEDIELDIQATKNVKLVDWKEVN